MSHGTPQPLLDWARWNGRKERKSATSTTGAPPIWERYQTFIKEHPHVLTEALHLARARLAAGAKRIGAKALWEELRTSIRVKKLGSYKLNNDYTALLARDLITADPRLERVIELRERKTRMDAAVDATTPINDMSNPIFLEVELCQSVMRLVCVSNPGFGCKAAIQRLVPTGPHVDRPHYVDLIVRSGDNARGAITEVLEVWNKVGAELVEIVNGLDPAVGR